MAAETLTERVDELEHRFREVEGRLAQYTGSKRGDERGWRWFLGIFADSPDFEEVVQIGEEWRRADSPCEDGTA